MSVWGQSDYQKQMCVPYNFSSVFGLAAALAESERMKFKVTKATGHSFINAMPKTYMMIYSTFIQFASVSCQKMDHVISHKLKTQPSIGFFPSLWPGHIGLINISDTMLFTKWNRMHSHHEHEAVRDIVRVSDLKVISNFKYTRKRYTVCHYVIMILIQMTHFAT